MLYLIYILLLIVLHVLMILPGWAIFILTVIAVIWTIPLVFLWGAILIGFTVAMFTHRRF